MKYSKYLMHYNHNHDKLGRFASSNTARTIASNEMLIKANRDMSKVYGDREQFYQKKASKVEQKIKKGQSKNKDTSKYEKRLSELKKEGKEYAEYKSNAEKYASKLEKENQKKAEEFAKLVDNSVISSIERDNLNRISGIEYNIKPEEIEGFDKVFRQFNQDLMSGKVNEMSDEQILKKYRKR